MSKSSGAHKLGAYLLWGTAGGVAAYLCILVYYAIAIVLVQIPGVAVLQGVNGYGPLFSAPIVIGIALGVFLAYKLKWRARWTLLILPASIFIYEAAGIYGEQYVSGSRVELVYRTFFGSQCQSSECTYEGFETGPLVLALSFLIGNAVTVFVLQRRRGPQLPQSTSPAESPHPTSSSPPSPS
jgi:hypothetical protein